jgi:hypothetical protein
MEMAKSRYVWIPRVGRMLRDGWLVLGISLLLFVAIDVALRGALALRDSQRRRAERGAFALHPYAREGWYAGWRERDWPGALERRYDAYRGWGMSSFAGDGLHIDSAGIRATIPAGRPDAPEVLLLGGSVMWGQTARDSLTIPSLVAAELLARGVNVQVRNLAQPGYVFTQGVASLLLELREGHVPAAVVFLDGVNDVGSAADYGVAGMIYFHRLLETRMKSASSATRAVLQAVMQHSAIGEILGPRLARLQRARNPVAPAVCGDVARHYRNQLATVRGLSVAHGFTVFFYWQPALATTRKPLTEWERTVRKDHPVNRLMAPCTDSVEAGTPGADFTSLRTIFDGDTSTVFLDQWGHLTEASNRVMAAVIVERLLPGLRTP